MKVNAEKLEGNKTKLTIEVPDETFEISMNKAFRQMASKFSIPGFRKGKAPRHMVERMYGRDVLLEDAINDAVPAAFSQAVEELGRQYECIVYPQYDVVSTDKGQGLVFTATYDLKPEIVLGSYKGMALEKISEALDENAVEDQLAAMRERFARLETTEEPAALGDVCTIDFLGKIDDEPFEGGEGKEYHLELGSKTFIPGFEDQLVGARAGDEVEIQVTFPEDYQAEDLAGKDAVFDVAVVEVQHKILADMDDEFAKDVSEFETLDELKKSLLEKLSKDAADKVQADFESKAVQKAIDDAEMDLPHSMIELREDHLLDNFASQLARQGIPVEAYLQYLNVDPETLRENFHEQAERELKTELVLEAIAEAEGINATEEEITAEYERLAEQTGKPEEEIRAIYEGNKTMLESLKFSLMMTKTVKLLADHAVESENSGEDQDVTRAQ